MRRRKRHRFRPRLPRLAHQGESYYQIERSREHTVTRYNYDGSLRDSTTYRRKYVEWECYRSYKQNSPLITWKGINLYRLPTEYKRVIIRRTYEDGFVRSYDSNGTLRSETKGVSPNYDDLYYGPHLDGSNLNIVQDGFKFRNQIYRAEIGALNKLSRRDIHLGNSLAEAKETLESIATPVKAFWQAYRAMRHGDVKTALSKLGVRKQLWGKFSKKKFMSNGIHDASNHWLALQFGWKPLLSDIHDLFTRLTKTGLHQPLTFSVTRQVTITDPFPKSQIDYDTVTWNGDSSWSCKVKLYAKVSNEALSVAQSLGLANPLEIAWELLPYSFVVDWFLPVGSLFESLTDTLGLTFVSGTRTVRIFGRTKGTYVPLNLSWTRTDGPGFGLCNEIFGFHRVVYTHFPHPVPPFKSPFSTTHCLDALALIQQAVSRWWRR